MRVRDRIEYKTLEQVQLMRLAPWRYATYSGGGPGHLLTSSDGTRSHASGICESGRRRFGSD